MHLANYGIYLLLLGDMAADVTKPLFTPRKIKDNEQVIIVDVEKKDDIAPDEGPSVEVKEEEVKEEIEEKPSPENVNVIIADSKPSRDKYSPKVSTVGWFQILEL